MARIKNSFGFCGKIGAMVGYELNGKQCIRSIPRKSNALPSKAQLAQREKFRVLQHFLQPFVPLVYRFYRPHAPNITAHNAAMHHNYHFALKGSYPVFYIDYAVAAITLGYLQNVTHVQVVGDQGGILRFNWQHGGGNGNDKMILVVYSPHLHQAIYITDSAIRSDETATIDAASFTGRVVQTWISCYSPLTGKAASSLYVGEVIV
jgi:hypothetical protein